MRFSRALLVTILLTTAFVASNVAQVAGPGPRVAGQVLVKFVPGAVAAARADAHGQAGGTVLAEIARTGLQLVAVSGGSEAAALERYRRNPNVLFAEPNYIRSIPEPADHAPGSEIVAGDFYFDEQWALRNVGQEFYCLPFLDDELCFYIGTNDADIDAPEAWAISMGDPAVRVAVIDSGIDFTHPDLAPHYVGGWDFVNGDADPDDEHGHGTHVSGTIAASVNNLTGAPGAAEGVAGVVPNASLLVYKVCTADGSCDDFTIAQAVAQAVVDGARVINLSLGGTDYSQAMYDSIQNAWNANVVIVAGAGNNASTQPFYPAAFDNVVSVAAFDEDHARASFSNYGSWVDISAPGNVIMSTYPMWACGVSTNPGDTGCYTWMSGTSMATPHVSGAAALVWSRGDVVSNAQVVDILLQSADPRGVNRRSRLSNWTIHGGLNLHDAMSYGVTNLAPAANAGPDQSVTDTDGDGSVLVNLDGGASSDPDGSIVAYEWREGASVLATTATTSVWLPIGVHTLTLQVTDNVGATDTDTVVIAVAPANYAPIASDTSASTVVGSPVVVTLSATDVETCELVFSLVGSPADGSLGPITNIGCVSGAPNSDTATVVYTSGGAGVFTFTYAAHDGTAGSNVATATVTVNPAPPVGGVTVSGITPSVVSRNSPPVLFTIAGAGFAPGASVAFLNGAGQSPVVLGVTVDGPTQISATVEIKSGGPRRDRVWDVQVTNPDGSSGIGAGLLTITP